MNLARLNHILIPDTKAGRDRLRNKRLVKLLTLVGALFLALSTEGRMMVLVWMVAGAAGLSIHASQTYLLFAGLTGLLAASLVVRRRYALKDVSVRIAAAPRVSVGTTLPLTLLIDNRSPQELFHLSVTRPLLPWDGRYLDGPRGIETVAAGSTTRHTIQTVFSARGEHHLDAFYLSATVPLGLALGPPCMSPGCRFFVVPKLANIARLDTPEANRYQPGGVALASQTGESREWFATRPYVPGDPIRDLHARSWARAGEPIVREFRQEHFTRIGVVLDTHRGAQSEAAFEAAVSLAAGVVAHLSRGEALVDVLVVGDQIHRMTVGRSLGFLDQALDLLACVQPGAPIDSADLIPRLAPNLSQLSCVVCVLLDWDAARRELVRRLQGQGVATKSLLVGDQGPPGTEVVPVDAETIADGKALTL